MWHAFSQIQGIIMVTIFLNALKDMELNIECILFSLRGLWVCVPIHIKSL